MVNKARIAKSMIHNIKNECPYSLIKRLLLPLKLKYGIALITPNTFGLILLMNVIYDA